MFITDIPDTILTYIWNILLAYPILSSATVYVILTTFESFFIQACFAVIDFGFIKADRLRVYERKEQTTKSYIKAIKMVTQNGALLCTVIALVALITTGNIHGNYAMQGISRDRLPLTAPTFLQWIFQTIIVIACADFGLYVTHRAFHTGYLYRKFHSVHHAYHDTIAIHSMCAHPVEIFSAVISLFLIPRALYECFDVHPLVVYLTPFIMTVHSVFEHSGYDDKISKLTFGLFTGSEMHTVHHQVSNKNFGFYTYLWDYLFGTMLSYTDMVTNINNREAEIISKEI